MKNTQDILDFVSSRIHQIYERPLMYGGTALGVDLILHCYNELWAEAGDKSEDYESLYIQAHQEQGCGSANFSTKFLQKFPRASELEVASYVIQQWKEIRKRLAGEE
jgi:hypothetical protein